MLSFCTLFDKNYLFQGITLFRSLLRTAKQFRLYALCMDQPAYDMIRKLNQPDLVPVHVSEIITDAETRTIRERTTHGQFCWVCQPLICMYILDRFKVNMVTYLEADSMFFSDPAVLFDELNGYSVSLVPHRYTPKFDKSKTSGKYCVQFNAFRNDPKARQVLAYWKKCCFEYSKDKPDYYPGQVTLDEWPIIFSCVREIENIGAGVAPWNVQQYEIRKLNGGVYVDNVQIVFYHFHQYCRYDDGSHELGAYPFTAEVIHDIYAPYVRELNNVKQWVQTINPAFSWQRKIMKPENLIKLAGSYVIRNIKGTYNIYKDEFFNRDK